MGEWRELEGDGAGERDEEKEGRGRGRGRATRGASILHDAIGGCVPSSAPFSPLLSPLQPLFSFRGVPSPLRAPQHAGTPSPGCPVVAGGRCPAALGGTWHPPRWASPPPCPPSRGETHPAPLNPRLFTPQNERGGRGHASPGGAGLSAEQERASDHHGHPSPGTAAAPACSAFLSLKIIKQAGNSLRSLFCAPGAQIEAAAHEFLLSAVLQPAPVTAAPTCA